jgi:hypothetical protein
MTRSNLVMSIAPTTRGFGYAIFAEPGLLLDWGVKEARSDKNRRIRAQVEALVKNTMPSTVVLENWFHDGCRRSKRVRQLLFDLFMVAHKGGAAVMVYSYRHIRQAFGESGKTKHSVATDIAKTLPALKPWLPPKRRIWESEHYSMAIFDAVALGLTHYRAVQPTIMI